MSDVGAAVAANRGAGPKTIQLNPERAPALIAKWQKLLGTDLERIEVVYSADGVSVDLYGMEGTPYQKKDKSGGEVALSIASFKKLKQEVNKPTATEAVTAFRNKFELRLNIEFPVNSGIETGSDAEIQAFLSTRPLAERRTMLMSNKQFKAAYPNGFGVVQAPNPK